MDLAIAEYVQIKVIEIRLNIGIDENSARVYLIRNWININFVIHISIVYTNIDNNSAFWISSLIIFVFGYY